MNVSDSYKILGTSTNPDIEEVKRSFRKRAFECHPDLHPEDPEASSKFQQLNEAYVTLLHYLEEQPREKTQNSTHHSREKSRKKYNKQKKASSTGYASQKKEHYQHFKNKTYQFAQEDILKNILNDPFASKVFEDIFRTVKRKKPDKKDLKTVYPKKIKLEWGKRKIDIDLSKFGWNGMKLWIRSQLDHEQTLYLAPYRILPGNQVSFKIKQRRKDPPLTITARIPKNYHAGRPIRLKGLGRKLGPWKGDLYLKLLTK